MTKLTHKSQKTGSITNTLLRLQLNPNEAKVYEYLLKEGASRAIQISKNTAINRTNTYNVLEQLREKGLVGRSAKGSISTFFVEHPAILQDILLDKRKELDHAQVELNSELASIVSMYQLSANTPGVYTFHGKEGLIRVYDQLLREGQHISMIINRPLFRSFLGDYNETFVKTRRKKKIKSRVLTPDYDPISSNDQLELREVRYLNQKFFPFEMDIKITDRTVVLTTLKAEQAVGILISNTEIARSFLVLFEYLWRIGDKNPLKT